ncbi:aromatic ring-hydroxylating dioxygenase subunit alpha [Paraburkholderia caffeinilytica]|uniref:(2Fe-2S)-binding protein n=1 Tax=Paraburkholderia caffeinilytica TaxID=1761016 RepID=A0ABQ1NGT5_9BURK|nr:aromatic ring-hydroxylating dioxygenase subunit alpha [Paraburkholderia caffeinilytica]GGC73848.1 (2Fe-2S)-binding protein [Paraburkholderia caffeinilytica]CAB3809455.1 Toluene-4-sulfonate monooxygenase system iron-sulfur subunit TsaM1 [Paraburkholderia caffeinilytica]
MFVRNCWYVAGWDNDVGDEGFLSRTIINVPLVFWRDAAGKVIALEDRCCHRGAKLSMGRKENGGDCVRCMYHGLVFDRTGQCISAPAQDRLPPQAKVRSFPIVESHRWIWIWMGNPDRADESLIPDTRWLDHPEWRSQDGYLHYDVNYLLIADNLLDFSHLPFLHPTTVGGSTDYASVLPKVERGERGVRLTKWVKGTQPPAYSAKYANYPEGALVDRWMYYDFLAPGVLLMDSGMMPAGTGGNVEHRESALAFRGCQALTPETETSTHYFFAHPHNFLIDRPEVTKEIHAGIVHAFEEDRQMITSQQQNIELDPSFKMVPLGIDAALSQFRWVVDKLIREEQPS